MRNLSPEQADVWIREAIDAFVHGPNNDLGMPGGREPAFGDPLVGIAAGDDPLWLEYKTHVGEFHWTPEEAFALAFPEAAVAGAELSIISWVLPQTAATRADHRKEKEFPAERWARARIMGEANVNDALRTHLVELLARGGVQSCSPTLLPEWSRMDSERFVFSSKWSERHAAYTAGNGTFGLCDGLITPVGKAMRLGSVIARLALPATKRPYSSHREYCLHFNSGICGKCAKRCPAEALTTQSHDKLRCKAYLRGVTAPYVKGHYHFDGYGCGFCQVGVPCEAGIPPRPRGAAART